LPSHPVPQAKDGGVVMQLCDGVTSTEIKGLQPGQPMTHRQAVSVMAKLMDEWQRKHPGAHWEMAQEQTAPAMQPSAQSTAAGSGSPNIAGPGTPNASKLPSQQGDTYASFHSRDFQVWQAETDAFVNQGNKIFHSAHLLGGTIGVSCDMCHPNAANTHTRLTRNIRNSFSAWLCSAI
jgi:thiosulfate dehydrogenase